MSKSTKRILSIGVFNSNSRCFSIVGPYLNEINNHVEFSSYLDYLTFYKENGERNFHKYLVNFISENNISHLFVFFTGWDFIIPPETLKNVFGKIPIVLFTFDTEYYFENLERYYAQYSSLVVTTDKYSSFAFQELGFNSFCAFSMHDGRNKFRKLYSNKDIDVSFIGNLNTGNRKNYISYLKSNSINIHDFGMNTSNGEVSEDRMTDIINRSKIVLNFTGLQNFNKMPPGIPRIRSRIKQSKGRPIETVLCGTFLLTEFSPGIQYMFDIEKHIAVFSTKEELLDKIKFYLENEQLREEMAFMAYNYSQENYELKNGFNKIFNIISEINLMHVERVFIFDKAFNIEYYFTHLKLAIYFALRLKLNPLWQELIILVKKDGFSFKRLIQEFIWYKERILDKLG